MIQDIIISVSLIFLSYALIPQIIQGFRKKKSDINTQTALISTIGIYVIAICFFTLKLYFSFTMNIVAGSLWAIILSQKLIYK